MMKKVYITPALKTKLMTETEEMMAASGETLPIIKDGETVEGGLSKENIHWESDEKSVWDD
jgi:hypothetical protein